MRLFNFKFQSNLFGIFSEGTVVKIGKDSIHAVVLGFASAAILIEDIRAEFKYRKVQT
jgi:hypothetical protein